MMSRMIPVMWQHNESKILHLIAEFVIMFFWVSPLMALYPIIVPAIIRIMATVIASMYTNENFMLPDYFHYLFLIGFVVHHSSYAFSDKVFGGADDVLDADIRRVFLCEALEFQFGLHQGVDQLGDTLLVSPFRGIVHVRDYRSVWNLFQFFAIFVFKDNYVFRFCIVFCKYGTNISEMQR